MGFRSRVIVVTAGLFAAACSLVVSLDDLRGADAGDAGATDAPAESASDASLDADADAAPSLFTCAESAGSRVAISQSQGLHSSRVRLGALANGNVRLVVVDDVIGDAGADVVLRSFTFDPLVAGAPTVAPLDTQGAPLFSLQRYGGASPGFAALYARSGSLWAVHLADSAQTWSLPVELAPFPGAGGDIEATFAPLDASSDSYFIVFSQALGTTQTIWSGDLAPESGALVPLQTFTTSTNNRAAYAWTEPAIAISSTSKAIMLEPQGSNGPPPVGAGLEVLFADGTSLQVTPPSNQNFLSTGFTASLDASAVNAAIIQADLNSLTASYRVGQVPWASLASVGSLLTTNPVADGGALTLDQLLIVNDSQHWETVGFAGEQLLVTAPTVNPITDTYKGGFNFAWWDGATGEVRAYQAGASHQVFSDVPFVGAVDATFATLVGSIAHIWVAYIADATQPNLATEPPGDLFFAELACQRGP